MKTPLYWLIRCLSTLIGFKMSHSNHVDSDGNAIPSVSQIPGQFAHDLSGFESFICKGLHGKEGPCCVKARNDYYQESANLGRDIHELMEAFLKGKPFTESVPEYQAAVFDPVARFYKDSGYRPLFMEEKMTGKEFGGTLDTAGTFSIPFWEKQRKTFWDDTGRDINGALPLPRDTDVWIVDLKIKSKIDPLHGLQLYGYSLLLEETKGINTRWGLIIRREKKLDKRPEIQLKAYYLPAYAETWKAAMLCWKFLNQ